MGSYSVVQCIRSLMGQSLYCSAADAGLWRERATVMASPPMHDSAVSPCFHPQISCFTLSLQCSSLTQTIPPMWGSDSCFSSPYQLRAGPVLLTLLFFPLVPSSYWVLHGSIYYSCLENPTDGGTWQAAVHGVARNRTRLSDFTFSFHFHALEKEMATHSSVLAWRIPGTEEPGGLLSLGSHRVRHDWSDLA